MKWEETVTEPDEVKVFEALDGPSYTWRTLSAIARQTRLSESRVSEILRKYNSRLTRFADIPSITGQPIVGLIETVGG